MASASQAVKKGDLAPLDVDKRDANDPHQDGLNDEHLEQAEPPPVPAMIRAPFLVAEIFRLAPVALEDVDGEAQAPDGHQGKQQPFAEGKPAGEKAEATQAVSTKPGPQKISTILAFFKGRLIIHKTMNIPKMNAPAMRINWNKPMAKPPAELPSTRSLARCRPDRYARQWRG